MPPKVLTANNSFTVFSQKGSFMLLERRYTPRFEVNPPSLITFDSGFTGKIINASETGLAVAAECAPALNLVVRASVQLPGDDRTTTVRAQTVWATSTGHLGLKLLQPGSFRSQFEAWQNLARSPYTGSDSAWQTDDGVTPSSPAAESASLAELRTALLMDEEPRKYPWSRIAPIIGAAIACTLLGGCLWLWRARIDQSPAGMAAQAPNVPPVSAPLSAGLPSANADIRIPEPVANAADPVVSTSSPGATAPPAEIQSLPEPHPHAKSRASAIVVQSHSAAESTEVVVKLSRLARLHPKMLRNPDRIYFDLSASTRAELPRGPALPLNTGLVRRIRVGHRAKGQTRLVLDLAEPCKYTYELSQTVPPNLKIKLRPARPAAVKPDTRPAGWY
jgi:AMIN domain/PilZ domain